MIFHIRQCCGNNGAACFLNGVLLKYYLRSMVFLHCIRYDEHTTYVEDKTNTIKEVWSNEKIYSSYFEYSNILFYGGGGTSRRMGNYINGFP